MDEKTLKILSRLEGQCSKREYCVSDILKKALDRTDGDREAADEIVASLQDNNFVSDFRYASAFAREKSSLTGWGPVKIRYALRAKKISAENIDAALEEIEPQKAEARLERLIENKRKSLEGDPQIKLKLIKFALSRGYDYDTVKDLV